MSDDYTPTTDEVREAWVGKDLSHTDDCTDCDAEFDRWFAGERAKWEKEVLEKAAERVEAMKARTQPGHQYGCFGYEDDWCLCAVPLNRVLDAIRGEG